MNRWRTLKNEKKIVIWYWRYANLNIPLFNFLGVVQLAVTIGQMRDVLFEGRDFGVRCTYSILTVPRKLISSTITARIWSFLVKPHSRPITTIELRGVSDPTALPPLFVVLLFIKHSLQVFGNWLAISLDVYAVISDVISELCPYILVNELP